MDTITLTQVLIFGGIALVIVLAVLYLSFFFKPGKQLKVVASLIHNETSDSRNLSVEIINIGKKGLKVVYPFVKFRNGRFSKLFQVKPDRVNTSFPKIIKPGEEYDCIIEITSYIRLLNKKAFSPKTLKVIIKDTVGVKFQSEIIAIA
ncbi:MAG: hypothetical protein JXA03_13400 [Bacteroidales bacterium]|nr:hypothetical protein [Bacteroidales bacterium]